MKKVILIALAVFLFFSCKKTDITDPATPPGPEIVYNVNKTQLLELVNDVRSKGCTCGTTPMAAVGAVTWNDQLAKAAYEHSLDMKVNNYFNHNTPDGVTPGQRITAAGYTWKTFGENIAMGYATEQAVINAWLASEGHCKNIMNGSFREMGLGKEGTYWTQVFGAR